MEGERGAIHAPPRNPSFYGDGGLTAGGGAGAGGGGACRRRHTMKRIRRATATITKMMRSHSVVVSPELELVPPPFPAATVRLVDAFACAPRESVTVTLTSNVPATVGLHASEGLLWEAQPVGSPV
jgi:hypothetical protein